MTGLCRHEQPSTLFTDLGGNTQAGPGPDPDRPRLRSSWEPHGFAKVCWARIWKEETGCRMRQDKQPDHALSSRYIFSFHWFSVQFPIIPSEPSFFLGNLGPKMLAVSHHLLFPRRALAEPKTNSPREKLSRHMDGRLRHLLLRARTGTAQTLGDFLHRRRNRAQPHRDIQGKLRGVTDVGLVLGVKDVGDGVRRPVGLFTERSRNLDCDPKSKRRRPARIGDGALGKVDEGSVFKLKLEIACVERLDVQSDGVGERDLVLLAAEAIYLDADLVAGRVSLCANPRYSRGGHLRVGPSCG